QGEAVARRPARLQAGAGGVLAAQRTDLAVPARAGDARDARGEGGVRTGEVELVDVAIALTRQCRSADRQVVGQPEIEAGAHVATVERADGGLDLARAVAIGRGRDDTHGAAD